MNLTSAYMAAPAPTQNWHEAVLEGIHAALLTTDAQGCILHMNKRAMQLCGGEDLSGQHILEVLAIEERIDGHCRPIPLERCLEDGTRIDLPCGVTMRTPAGLLQGWMNIGPIHGPGGEVTGAVILLGLSQVAAPAEEAAKPLPMPMQDNALFVKKDGTYVRIEIAAIKAVEAMENYVQIILDKERHVVHATMKNMHERLLRHGFIRIHRSYLVPFSCIDAFDDTKVIVCGRTYPVGKSYKGELMAAVSIL